VDTSLARRGLRRYPDVTDRPDPLVLTAGEPAGIGPELCLAIAAGTPTPDFIVVSDIEMLQQRADTLDIGIGLRQLAVGEVGSWRASSGELAVIHTPFPESVVCGQPTPGNAMCLLDGLRIAVDGCREHRFAAMVTAPLAKNVIAESGVAFTGHTEFLAELTGTELPVMMLAAGQLRVALASTHLPLRDVADYITRPRLRAVLGVLRDDLQKKFGIDKPEILVCGLNPHAGESGLLGSEDADVIAPVVREFQARGDNVRGPLPADTAFTPAAGTADAILAMYHDQGLPVLKYAGFGDAVNITLGLPIIRTSVDHGTAFDLAGSGKADIGSLSSALVLARQMARLQSEDAAGQP